MLTGRIVKKEPLGGALDHRVCSGEKEIHGSKLPVESLLLSENNRIKIIKILLFNYLHSSLCLSKNICHQEAGLVNKGQILCYHYK